MEKILDSGSENGISEIMGINGATLPLRVEIRYVVTSVVNPKIILNSNKVLALFFIQYRLRCRQSSNRNSEW